MGRNRRWIALAAGCALAASGAGCSDSASTDSSVRTIGARDAQLTRPAEGGAAASGTGANHAPVVRRVTLDPQAPVPGVPVRAIVEADDPDGDFVRLTFSWYRNGRLVSESGKGTITFDELAKSDQVEVRVLASDGRLSSDVVRAQSHPGNRVPYLTNVYLTPDNRLIRRGQVLKAHPEGNDDDNDDLRFSYRWVANGHLVGEEREFDTSTLKRGDKIHVEVVATDGQVESSPRQSREIEMANSPPRITQLPRMQVDGGELRYAFKAEDADGDRNLRFWVENGPDGMEMDSLTGELTWKPRADQAGVHPVEVGVKDGLGDGTKFEFNVTVNATTEPAPPASVR